MCDIFKAEFFYSATVEDRIREQEKLPFALGMKPHVKQSPHFVSLSDSARQKYCNASTQEEEMRQKQQ